MNIKATFIYLVLLSMPLWTGAANAGKADISGTFSYQVTGSNVNVKIARISNNTSTYTTGSIYVTLRFTQGSSPFSTGYNVARKSLIVGGDSRLSPGEYFYNISFNANYDRPPDGVYYVHLYVSEYPNLNTSLDYVTFSSRATVGNPGGKAIDMFGTMSYSISGNSVRIKVGKIDNNSSTTTTGTLYITMWLTTSPDLYSTGFLVARKSLSYINGGTLSPGRAFTGISFDTSFARPPNGQYYVHFYVSQYPNQNTVLDSFTFNDRLTIGSSGGKPGKPKINYISRGMGGGIAIEWSSVSSATSYKIYRASCKTCKYVIVEQTTTRQWTDTRVKPGKTFWYKVKACNSQACGKKSKKKSGKASR